MLPESSEKKVGLLILISLGDRSELGLGGGLGNGEVADGLLTSSGGGESLGGSVIDESLLGLSFAPGEENEFVLVAVKSIHVQLELVFAGRLATVVNRDSDLVGESGTEASHFQFREGEASAIADLTGVLTGLRGHNRAERFNGSGEHFGRLSLSKSVAFALQGCLIEVGVDESSALPVLAKMYVRDLVVVLGHWRFIYSIIKKTLRN